MSCPKESECWRQGMFDTRRGKDYRLDVCMTLEYKSCQHYKKSEIEDDRGPEDPYKKIIDGEA